MVLLTLEVPAKRNREPVAKLQAIKTAVAFLVLAYCHRGVVAMGTSAQTTTRFHPPTGAAMVAAVAATMQTISLVEFSAKATEHPVSHVLRWFQHPRHQ